MAGITRLVNIAAGATGNQQAAATGQGRVVRVECAGAPSSPMIITLYSGATVASGTLIGRVTLNGLVGLYQQLLAADFTNGLSLSVGAAATTSILITIE